MIYRTAAPTPKRRPRLPAARGILVRAAFLYAAPVPLFITLGLLPAAGLRLALALAAAALYILLGVYLDHCAGRHARDVIAAVRNDAEELRGLSGRDGAGSPARARTLGLD